MNKEKPQKNVWVISCLECPGWHPGDRPTIDAALAVADEHDTECHRGAITAEVKKSGEGQHG